MNTRLQKRKKKVRSKLAGPESKYKRIPTLAQLLNKITNANRHREFDWGRPVGNEIP
jgi:antitoxin component of MazEF toxin-antitoxin module